VLLFGFIPLKATTMMADKDQHLVGDNTQALQDAHTSLVKLKMNLAYQEAEDHARADTRLFNAALETMLSLLESRRAEPELMHEAVVASPHPSPQPSLSSASSMDWDVLGDSLNAIDTPAESIAPIPDRAPLDQVVRTLFAVLMQVITQSGTMRQRASSHSRPDHLWDILKTKLNITIGGDLELKYGADLEERTQRSALLCHDAHMSSEGMHRHLNILENLIRAPVRSLPTGLTVHFGTNYDPWLEYIPNLHGRTGVCRCAPVGRNLPPPRSVDGSAWKAYGPQPRKYRAPDNHFPREYNEACDVHCRRCSRNIHAYV
jgi:hypothetical protein